MARLEALENDNAGIETIEPNDDDEASLDDDDQGFLLPHPLILSPFHFMEIYLTRPKGY